MPTACCCVELVDVNKVSAATANRCTNATDGEWKLACKKGRAVPPDRLTATVSVRAESTRKEAQAWAEEAMARSDIMRFEDHQPQVGWQVFGRIAVHHGRGKL